MSPAKICGIYLITVTRPGRPHRFYIGQSSDIRERCKGHMRAEGHDNVVLQRIYAKHGADVLAFSTVLVCGRDMLTEYEQIVLDHYAREFGDGAIINVMRQCVRSHLGVKRRPESVAKLTAAITGKKRTQESIEINRRIAKERWADPAERAKMIASMQGLKHSPEERAAKSIRQMGHFVSPETGAKISAAKTGFVHSDETKAKISAALMGTKQSPELIEKRISKIRGKKLTPETRAKRAAVRAANKAAGVGAL